MFRTTKHTHAVSNALRQAGFELFTTEEYEYKSVKRTFVQSWRNEPGDKVTVYFTRDCYISGYSSSAYGYADVHGEGRVGGVWRPKFSHKDCLALLVSNAAEGRLVR